MMLAMKLQSTQRRGRREMADLAVLLPLCGIETVEEAEELYGEFYPGDEFTTPTARRVQSALDNRPTIPETHFPDLDGG